MARAGLVRLSAVGALGVLLAATFAVRGSGPQTPTARAGTAGLAAPPTPALTAQASPAAVPSAAAGTSTPPVPPVSDYRNLGEVAIPMRLVVPSIALDIPLYAVGQTASGAMDAPEGPPSSPTWHQGFWYRGGVIPGQLGTATVAGHLDDSLGRPGAFWNLRELHAGQLVEVVDLRSGSTLDFRITETDTYSDAVVNSRPVLTRIFGPDAVAGRPPGTTPGTVARLVLITCAGTFTHGAYDHRYVIYAQRVS